MWCGMHVWCVFVVVCVSGECDGVCERCAVVCEWCVRVVCGGT